MKNVSRRALGMLAILFWFATPFLSIFLFEQRIEFLLPFSLFTLLVVLVAGMFLVLAGTCLLPSSKKWGRIQIFFLGLLHYSTMMLFLYLAHQFTFAVHVP